jgi:uncharacterized membrane protein
MVVSKMDIYSNNTYKMYNADTITYEKGIVIEVLEERVESAEGMPGWSLGVQTIIVELKDGPLKGKAIKIENNLSTTHNIRVRSGHSVIIKADRPKDVAPYYTVYNYDRTPGLIASSALLIAFIIAMGSLKGLRSVLGLGISLLFILGFLHPSIYRGYSPIAMSIITIIAIASSSLFLLNGLSRKTVAAMAATIAGEVLAAGFFFLISALLNLSGYNVEGAEELIMVSRNTGMKLGQVLFVGVMISSLGAVMDITLSIASSL